MVNWNALETRPTLQLVATLRIEMKYPPGGHVWPQCGHRNGLLPPPGHVAELKRRMKVDYVQCSKMECHPTSQQNLTQVDHQND